MIFGRKKKAEAPIEEADEAVAVEEVEETGPAAETDAAGDQDWAAFDVSQDWREHGPFDVEEVDLEADEIKRLDLGSLIVTPPPGAELRLQVAEGTQTIVSVLVLVGESAIELSAFSAPRSTGLWAEIREQIIEQTATTGGSADCVVGPFGTELVRNLPVQLPDGRSGFQVTRTWAVEGPRWLLRGVVMGKAALSNEIDDDLVGPLFDAFCDVIVRRGDAPKPVGDLLPLSLPADVTAVP